MAIITNLKNLTPRREQYKRIVRLISGGYYNRKAFPTGEVTVYPWDSQMDAWFTERCRQPDRERALWEAAAKVSDLNGCPLNDLIVGDVWTILMVSKSIRSDCVVQYVAVCPSCQTKQEDKVRVPDELAVIAKKELNFTGTEEITLPDSGDVVKVRFLNVGDEIHIAERSEELKAEMSDHLAHILLPVMAVGGGTVENRQEVLGWYNALSPKDAEYLDKRQNDIYPQLDTDLPHVCDKCKQPFAYALDLNRDFFRAGEH